MYQPKAFSNNHIPTLHEAMEKRPFATLFTAVPPQATNSNQTGEPLPVETAAAAALQASHVPLHLDRTPSSGAPCGKLVGHLSSSNPHCQRLRQHLSSSSASTTAGRREVPVLAVYSLGDAYITPNWYPEKHRPGPDQGKVVPTWDFVAVQARGYLSLIECPKELEERVLVPLTDHHEALTAAAENATASAEAAAAAAAATQCNSQGCKLVRKKKKMVPWKVSDAPREYTELLKAAITGFEIRLIQVQGSWKLSQNKSNPTMRSVAKGLRRQSSQNPSSLSSPTIVADAIGEVLMRDTIAAVRHGRDDPAPNRNQFVPLVSHL